MTIEGAQRTSASAGMKRLSSTAFVIFSDRPGPLYAELLAEELEPVLRERGVEGRAVLRQYPENDGQLLDRASEGMDGLVLIQPIGGLEHPSFFDVRGQFTEIRYRVRVLRAVSEGFELSWQAYVDTQSGGWEWQVRNRLRLMAERLVARLVDEGLIAGGGSTAE